MHDIETTVLQQSTSSLLNPVRCKAFTEDVGMLVSEKNLVLQEPAAADGNGRAGFSLTLIAFHDYYYYSDNWGTFN